MDIKIQAVPPLYSPCDMFMHTRADTHTETTTHTHRQHAHGWMEVLFYALDIDTNTYTH